jgi:hypothetical protein
MATRTNATFEKKFKPIFANGDQESIIQPHDLPDEDEYDDRYLWTLIDPMVASGAMFWVPGYHFVNRVGYIFTENPWNADDLNDEYRYF